jgi:hypothetical protein
LLLSRLPQLDASPQDRVPQGHHDKDRYPVRRCPTDDRLAVNRHDGILLGTDSTSDDTKGLPGCQGLSYCFFEDLGPICCLNAAICFRTAMSFNFC